MLRNIYNLVETPLRKPIPSFVNSFVSLSTTLSSVKRVSISTCLTQQPSKQVIFSGIQPTGIPHLGNYLGALRQWVHLQDTAPTTTDLIYSIVDLHAITVRQNPGNLRKWKKETLATLLAVGLDPQKSIIFFQSAISAHTELMWILSCTASVGYLSRMTQWKSKLSSSQDDGISDALTNVKLELGLLSYPVLQAADVLVHRATHVPVGEDQAQHLEFARECATSFNHAYAKLLPLPTTILSPAKRVMSLKQPQFKMSKSHEDPRSRILLTEEPEEIVRKIRLALTDSIVGISYDPLRRPGVSNLLEIMAHFGNGSRTCQELAHECNTLTMRQFKEKVADCIVSNLSGIRSEYYKILRADGGRFLDDVAEKGAKKARINAEVTMALVREAVGF